MTSLVLGSLLIANTAAAQPTTTASTATVPAVTEPATTEPGVTQPMAAEPMATPPMAPQPTRDSQTENRSRARFSGKRLLLEALGGAVVGSALGYLVYTSTCGEDSGCIGPALLALGTNVVVTPLTVYGIGELGGGNGSLGRTYLLGLSGGGLGLIQPPQLGLALTLAFMPLTSALGYELSSNTWAREHDVQVNVAPVAITSSDRGGVATLSLRF